MRLKPRMYIYIFTNDGSWVAKTIFKQISVNFG